MKEYFIVANSFAAPFLSKSSTGFQEAESPIEALELFAVRYKHSAGLYAAFVYLHSDAYHKGKPALARWLSNHARELEDLTKNKSGYSFMGHAPGKFEIDGKAHSITNPKAGSVVPLDGVK